MIKCHDEDLSVYNGHYEVDVLIDRPVSVTRKQFLDVGSWVVTHDIELVSGSRDAEGAITRVSFRSAKELGMPGPHHHFCKLTKLILEQQYVLKTYSEKGGSYGWQITAFDDTRFFDVGGKTRITFNLFVEMKGNQVIKDRPALDRATETSREGMIRNLNSLKRIVEGG